MAKCPACAHEVATPFVLNTDACRWLTCPYCAVRLERKNPQIVFPLMSFWVALLALSRMGHRLAVIAEVLMVAIFLVILAKFMRPELQLRKPLPKPEIELKINDPSN